SSSTTCSTSSSAGQALAGDALAGHVFAHRPAGPAAGAGNRARLDDAGNRRVAARRARGLERRSVPAVPPQWTAPPARRRNSRDRPRPLPRAAGGMVLRGDGAGRMGPVGGARRLVAAARRTRLPVPRPLAL